MTTIFRETSQYAQVQLLHDYRCVSVDFIGVPCPCENGGDCVSNDFATLAEVECTCGNDFTGRLCQSGKLYMIVCLHALTL